jgi:hypothetical protein
MIYIPFFKNDHIMSVSIGGTAIVLLFLCYKAWVYEGLFSWLLDMVGWGFSAYCCIIALTMYQEGRCPNCGHFSLSMRGVTKRYRNAEAHFRFLSSDGTEVSINGTDDLEVAPEDVGNHCCPHCMKYSKG